MTTLCFKVLGDKAGPYTIDFFKSADRVSMTCSCAERLGHGPCKHIINVLHMSQGYRRTTCLVSKNKNDIYILAEALKDTDIFLAHDIYVEYEGRMQMAKEDFAAARENVYRAINGEPLL